MSEGKHVAIVGVGGVGTYAALACAQADRGQPGLIRKLSLFDADNLEERNLGRVPFGTRQVGLPKVLVVQRWLSDLHPQLAVVQEAYHIDANNIDIALADVDVVICCTDRVDSQRLINTWCDLTKTNGRKPVVYQRAGYDGDTINVTRALPLTFDPEAERADEGYHGVPEVYHAILAGTLAAYSVLRSPIVLMGEVKNLTTVGATFVPEPIAASIADERWQDLAENADWHSTNDCEIPDDYHHYNDCNHDDCIDEETAVENFLTQRPRDGVGDLPQEWIDYIVEQNTDMDAVVDNDPTGATAALQAVHASGNCTGLTNRYKCPWCELDARLLTTQPQLPDSATQVDG
jgi:hypothetical protein